MTVLPMNMCELPRENDEVDRLPSRDKVTYWDVVALAISISSHLIDIGLDVNLAYRYYTNEHLYYFILTLGFIVVPAWINTAFSIRMYMHDGTKNKLVPHTLKNYRVYVIVLVLQLAPVIRYVDSLKYALRSLRAERRGDFTEQRRYYELMLKEDSDVALLRVLECFLEAAPQQILQITILLVTYGGLASSGASDNTFTVFHQILSIGSSFVSMAWSMAAYHRSVRFVLDTKHNISKTGTAVQFLWHLLVTISRILSISVLASTFPVYTALGILVHWLVMTLWLCCTEKTNFCNQHMFYDTIFFAIFGLVYTFTHVNLSEGKTRCKYLFFYVVCFIENFIATAVWVATATSELRNRYYYLPIIILNITSFIVGIVFMIIYYKVFHPSKGLKSRHKTNNSLTVIESE